jgi:GDP-L-fucose synthase
MMKIDSNIYVAGHRGMVGAAILKKLQDSGYSRIITRSHKELDLLEQDRTQAFFTHHQPEYVFLAAAHVGGIMANNSYPADFIYNNLQIQNNVIDQCYRNNVKKLLFLGSSCIYPKFASQPLKEQYLMTGELEPTNAAYAVAKIAGIELCWSFNRQHGTQFIPVMPTNLYGPRDNFDLTSSHVLPALIRKFHLAKLSTQGDWNSIKADQERFGSIPGDIMASLISISESHGFRPPEGIVQNQAPKSQADNAVILWGTGAPMREMLYVDDLADACIFLMQRSFEELSDACGNPDKVLLNIGTGEDLTIKKIALTVAQIVGYRGEIYWDKNKPDGTPRKLLDVSRVQQLGWKYKTGLEDGIQMVYSWYLRQTKHSMMN